MKTKHDDEQEEKDQGGTSTATPKTPAGMRRIRLVRSIVLSGEHEDIGSVHDATLPLAQRLIGEGSAVDHLEEGESPYEQATSVNRMEEPSNRDPKTIRISRPAPKIKPAAEKK